MKTIASATIVAIAALAAARLSTAGEPACNAEPSCGAPASGDPGCCCPKCGCHEGLVPVCHPYCATKKIVKYKYCCKCDELCIPGRSPCCSTCGDGSCEKGCAANCGCNSGGCEQGHCNCLYRNVHTLVKIPYTVEVPVRKCTIEWVCPHCGCPCGSTESPGESQAPNAAPAPGAPIAPPPPPKSAQRAATDAVSLAR